jgi:hypothetical protein
LRQSFIYSEDYFYYKITSLNLKHRLPTKTKTLRPTKWPATNRTSFFNLNSVYDVSDPNEDFVPRACCNSLQAAVDTRSKIPTTPHTYLVAVAWTSHSSTCSMKSISQLPATSHFDSEHCNSHNDQIPICRDIRSRSRMSIWCISYVSSRLTSVSAY